MHDSPLLVSFEFFPHDLRLQVVFVGIGASGSSLSSSSLGSGAAGLVGAIDASDSFAGFGAVFSVEIGFRRGASSGGTSFLGGVGVLSTVECFPVVHGGICRNSSNVNTRGLQQFHPDQSAQIKPPGCSSPF